MSKLSTFDVAAYKREFKLDGFIETGTWYGEGLSFACNLGFEKLASIDIYDHNVSKARRKIGNNKNVKIIQGQSVDMLPDAIKFVDKERVFFWLDAHLPSHYGSNNDSSEVVFPLKKEIEIIMQNRNVKNDVFIMDDLRIFEDGPFTSGNWSQRASMNIGSMSFIYDLLEKTHKITKHYELEGSIMAVPR